MDGVICWELSEKSVKAEYIMLYSEGSTVSIFLKTGRAMKSPVARLKAVGFRLTCKEKCHPTCIRTEMILCLK